MDGIELYDPVYIDLCRVIVKCQFGAFAGAVFDVVARRLSCTMHDLLVELRGGWPGTTLDADVKLAVTHLCRFGVLRARWPPSKCKRKDASGATGGSASLARARGKRPASSQDRNQSESEAAQVADVDGLAKDHRISTFGRGQQGPDGGDDGVGGRDTPSRRSVMHRSVLLTACFPAAYGCVRRGLLWRWAQKRLLQEQQEQPQPQPQLQRRRVLVDAVMAHLSMWGQSTAGALCELRTADGDCVTADLLMWMEQTAGIIRQVPFALDAPTPAPLPAPPLGPLDHGGGDQTWRDRTTYDFDVDRMTALLRAEAVSQFVADGRRVRTEMRNVGSAHGPTASSVAAATAVPSSAAAPLASGVSGRTAPPLGQDDASPKAPVDSVWLNHPGRSLLHPEPDFVSGSGSGTGGDLPSMDFDGDGPVSGVDDSKQGSGGADCQHQQADDSGFRRASEFQSQAWQRLRDTVVESTVRLLFHADGYRVFRVLRLEGRLDLSALIQATLVRAKSARALLYRLAMHRLVEHQEVQIPGQTQSLVVWFVDEPGLSRVILQAIWISMRNLLLRFLSQLDDTEQTPVGACLSTRVHTYSDVIFSLDSMAIVMETCGTISELR